MSRTSVFDKLTNDEVLALAEFAAEYGRKWKGMLRVCWQSSMYLSTHRAAELQSVRNKVGPSGLQSITTEKLKVQASCALLAQQIDDLTGV